MNRRWIACLLAIALCAGLVEPSQAQSQAAKDLVGTWAFVLNETTRADGTKIDTYGVRPKGVVMFDAAGNFSLFIANPDRKRFASNSRLNGTPEEYKDAVHGAISYYGKYAVDSDGKVLTFQLEASTFPNWDGVTQKRPFSVAGDELRFSNTVGSSGGSVLAILKRVN